MSFEPHIIDKLGEPLDRNKVSQRKQSGRTLDYIEGWHAIAEANRIFGHDGWVRETVTLTETNRDLVDLKSDRGDYQQWRVGYLAKVRITAHGVVREGVGFGSGIGRPELLGDAIESAIKEAETDATKRALMTFGWPFGLALYDKSREHVEDGRKPEPKPAAQQKAPADDMPGAVEYYLDWFSKVEDLDGLATAFEQFWRNGRAGLEAADVERVTAAKDKRKNELARKAA